MRETAVWINQARDIAQFGNNCDGNVIYSENEFQLYQTNWRKQLSSWLIFKFIENVEAWFETL